MPVFSPSEERRLLEQIDYDVIDSPSAVRLLRRRVAELTELDVPLGVDTETTGLNPIRDRVRLIQVASRDYALLVDLNAFRTEDARQVDWSREGPAELKALLEGDRPKILQNAAFDLNFLLGEGIDLGGPLFDTMMAAKTINNGTPARNGLGDVVKRNLGFELSKAEQTSNWGEELTPEQLRYAAMDAAVLCRLAPLLEKQLHEAVIDGEPRLLQIFRLEMQCLRPISRMQWHGFGFDEPAARQLMQELEVEAAGHEKVLLEALDAELRRRHPEDESQWLPRELDGSFNTNPKETGSIRLGTKRYAGFNPRSKQQMAARLSAAGIILPPNEKGVPSMDQNLLAFIRDQYPLLQYYDTWNSTVTLISHVEKLLNSVEADGRIHGSYRQAGTKTGRLSAAEPNLQQIPREARFRCLFKAKPNYRLVVADFSQIELRVAAELSGEEVMRKAYRAGRDLHTETAALISGKKIEDITKEDRTSAKICNFGLLYGAGAATLRKQAAAQYGVHYTHSEACDLVNSFRAAYPRLKQWQDEEGNKSTKAVYTKLGRRRLLSGYDDKYTTRINTQVQGTAGDIAKIAIAKLWRKLQTVSEAEARLISMVHDEIVMEVKQELTEYWMTVLSGAMEEAGSIVCRHVPIVAEASCGPTWADAK